MTRFARVAVLFLAVLALFVPGAAQTTEFTYQGQLQSSSSPANGSFDFEFALFDGGGSQIGSTLTRSGVAVANGIFTVNLDFGSSFPGASRFLEIRVRQAGGGAFTTLAPRQPLTSTPYAVKSLNSENAVNAATAANATQLGGVAASQFVQTTDARLMDARTPTAGSPNYIQNTALPQAASNFNISGNGTVGGTLSAATVNAGTQYNIGGSRVLSVAGSQNVFAGIGAGQASTGQSNSFFGFNSGTVTTNNGNSFFGSQAGRDNTTGFLNSFFGSSAGSNNTTGSNNSFFGQLSGSSNTTGSDNSFFGRLAGESTTVGSNNAFFGSSAGRGNTTGERNAFFGVSAGVQSTTGSGLAFFGYQAGEMNTTGGANAFFGNTAGRFNSSGAGNSFFGAAAGRQNTTGGFNSFFGLNAGVSNTQGINNSYFGANAGQDNVLGSNNTYVGYVAGDNATGSDNSFVGSDAGGSTTSGSENTFVGRDAGDANTTGTRNTVLGSRADVGTGALTYATAIGAGAIVTSSNTVQLGRLAGQDTVFAPGQMIVGENGGTDVEPSGGGGYIIAGATNSLNVTIDNNEIMARNSGATATLALNADGGDVNLIQSGTGNVGIGTNNPALKLHVVGQAGKTEGGASWVIISDMRLKNSVTPFTPGLDAIKRLNPIKFRYRPENPLGLPSSHENVGFSAQEVQKVLPEAVTTNSSGYLQISSDPIFWTMLNAIKEQQTQIENLRRVNGDQQNQINQLKRIVYSRKRRSTTRK
jgi:hypothetical protein